MRRPGSKTPRALRALLPLAMSLAILATPALARADLYKYQTADGDILITTERRPGLKLVEVLSGGGGEDAREAPARKRRSSKVSKNIARAEQARRQHIARHGDRHAPPADGPRHTSYDDIIREASATYDVPFAFIKAVVRVESNFNPLAVSHAGAQGLMQLMPRTASSLGVRDPFDPRQNIFGGAKLLRLLIDRYDGDINLILAAYNAGDVAVNRYDGIPYPQTRHYVASVYRWYKVYSAQQDDSP